MSDGKLTNVVVIGSREKGIESYIYSILLRMAPSVYNDKKHRCIILQIKGSQIDFAQTIINLFKHAGLEEVSRTQKDFTVGGYILEGGWEIVLKKIHEEKSLFDYVSERMES